MNTVAVMFDFSIFLFSYQKYQILRCRGKTLSTSLWIVSLYLHCSLFFCWVWSPKFISFWKCLLTNYFLNFSFHFIRFNLIVFQYSLLFVQSPYDYFFRLFNNLCLFIFFLYQHYISRLIVLPNFPVLNFHCLDTIFFCGLITGKQFLFAHLYKMA